MFKYAIFDVDGTILDTEKVILQSFQNVLKEEGKEYPLEELRFALGIPGKESLRRLQIMDVDRVHAKWSQTELAFSQEVPLFNGVKDIIELLSESPIRMGIVTSKTKQALEEGFERFGMGRFFECTICVNDTKHHKPHPEPLLVCLERMNAAQHEAIYIGDSIYDMQCAQRAGVKFALALWGAKKTEGFESADFLLHEPKDLLEIINI